MTSQPKKGEIQEALITDEALAKLVAEGGKSKTAWSFASDPALVEVDGPGAATVRLLRIERDLAVELGLGALHLQVDLLAEFVAEVAHDARQLLPGIADRLHARLHDAFLQLRRDVIEALQRRPEVAVLLIAQDLEQLIAGERNRLVELLDAFARGRQHLLGLLELEPGVDARRIAVTRQRVELLAAGERRLRDVERHRRHQVEALALVEAVGEHGEGDDQVALRAA